MTVQSLTHIDSWLFDLDNTLYPANCGLFTQVKDRMTHYVARHFDINLDAARKIQHDLFLRYGTTLNGMMCEHGIDVHDFLDFVHDIDYAGLPQLDALAAKISGLPGRKAIFTNADRLYTEKVLRVIGMDGLFDHIHDIHDSQYLPKPHIVTYENMLRTTGITPESCAFFEDMAINLKPAKALGMTTIWLDSGEEWARDDTVSIDNSAPDYIDYCASDLESWFKDWQPLRNA